MLFTKENQRKYLIGPNDVPYVVIFALGWLMQ